MEKHSCRKDLWRLLPFTHSALGRASSAMMWVVWMEEVPDGGQPGWHPPLSHHLHTVHSASQDRAAPVDLFLFQAFLPVGCCHAVSSPAFFNKTHTITANPKLDFGTLPSTNNNLLLCSQTRTFAQGGDVEGCLKLTAEDKRRFRQIISHCGVNDARLRSSEVTKLDVDKVAFLTPSQIFHFYFLLPECRPSSSVGWIFWSLFWGKSGLVRRNSIHHTRDGAALLSSNIVKYWKA